MEDIPEPESNSELDPDWRYSQAYEMITGKEFSADVGEVLGRIKQNLRKAGLL